LNSDLETSNSELTSLNSDLETSNSVLETQMSNLNTQIDSHTTELEELKTQIDSKGTELQELEILKSDLSALLASQTQIQSKEIQALETQATQLNFMTDQRDSLVAENETLKEQIEKILKENYEEIQRLQIETLQEMESQVSINECNKNTIASIEGENQKLKMQIMNLNLEIDRLLQGSGEVDEERIEMVGRVRELEKEISERFEYYGHLNADMQALASHNE
jgi:chromosome segregation ATPase